MSLPSTTDHDFTPEQVALIKETVAKGASINEFKLFLYRCKALDLDPLKPGQIHFVKYGNGPGTIVIGIEGFRVKAARTNAMAGIQRGVIRNADGLCIGAWCEVHRKDWTHPAREEVSLEEYNTGNGPWRKMPETMIKKVAEAAALRMAFPDDLGGIYVNEEMDQARRDELPRVGPEQPLPGDGVVHAGQSYRIPGGTFARRGLSEIAPKDLAEYITKGEKRIEKDPSKKPLWWDDFIEEAETYLGNLENQPREGDNNGTDDQSDRPMDEAR